MVASVEKQHQRLDFILRSSIIVEVGGWAAGHYGEGFPCQTLEARLIYKLPVCGLQCSLSMGWL